jgi:hypothetical protein
VLTFENFSLASRFRTFVIRRRVQLRDLSWIEDRIFFLVRPEFHILRERPAFSMPLKYAQIFPLGSSDQRKSSPTRHNSRLISSTS